LEGFRGDWDSHVGMSFPTHFSMEMQFVNVRVRNTRDPKSCPSFGVWKQVFENMDM